MNEFRKMGSFRSCLNEIRSNYLFDRATNAAERGNRQKADALFKQAAEIVTRLVFNDLVIYGKDIMRGETMPAWASHFTYWGRDEQPKKHRGFTVPKRPPDFGTYILQPAWFTERFVAPAFNRDISRLERQFRKNGYDLVAIVGVKDAIFDHPYGIVRAWLTPRAQSRQAQQG